MSGGRDGGGLIISGRLPQFFARPCMGCSTGCVAAGMSGGMSGWISGGGDWGSGVCEREGGVDVRWDVQEAGSAGGRGVGPAGAVAGVLRGQRGGLVAC